MKVAVSSLLVLVVATIFLMSGGIPSSAAPPERVLAAEPVEVLTGDNNYFLKINLRDARVRPRVMLANNDSGGLQSLSGIKSRLENQGYASWAIVNGDLFSASCPGGVNCAQGLTYVDGQRKDNWSAYGNTWMVRGNLGLDSSNSVQIAVGDGQTRRHMTIGGGPRIVMGGGAPTCSGELVTVGGDTKTYFPASGEYFDGDVRSWCSDTRAITLLGYSADGEYLYMGISQGGKTVTQLAQWLKDRGAHEVLRLDSGGSSGMYHDGSFVGGSSSRAIADAFALIVESGPPPPTPTPQPPPGDWYVEYFPNTNLTDLCATGSHSGTFVFRDWQEDQPSGDCPADNWSARFRRKVHFQTGSYTFALGSDDWARILVEFPPNEVVVNNWQGAGQHYESRYINEGDYWVTVEFADTLGHAKLVAWWWGPGFSMPRESRDPNQWYAEYWGNKDLWWDSIIRVNEGTTLNHEWYDNGPGHGLPDDRFSSRFERRVHFACGQYGFSSYADDGVRFKIEEVDGGNWLINEWHDGRDTYTSDPVDLAEGDYTLILEHYENGGWARVSLSWELLQACPLPAPSNLTATGASQSQINLTWDSASIDVSTFFIARSQTGSDPWDLIDWVDGNARTYQDSGLGCERTFYYKVMAYRSLDDQYSDYSNVAPGTTLDCPPVQCNDPYENNDVPAEATSISYSEWEYTGFDICPAGDVDYYAFDGNAGDEIVAEAIAGGSSLDPYLYLYDVDGVTVLAENDDYGGLDSRIEWTLPADGTYYLKVREYSHPSEGGPDYGYWMTLSAGGANVGPLAYHSHSIDDDNEHSTVGDDDGVADCGETVNLEVALENQGLLPAYWVTGTLTTSDSYLTWLTNIELWFGQQFPAGTTKTNFEDKVTRPEHLLALDPATPDGHLIHFDLDVYAANGGPWQESFDMQVSCPSQPSPQLTVETIPESVLMGAGEYRDITYYFNEGNGVDVHIDSRTSIFTYLSGELIGSLIGPYANDIDVPGDGMRSWIDHVYLPPGVFASAGSTGASTVLLRTTFTGEDPNGRPVSVEATLRIHLVKTRLRLPLALKSG